MVRNWVLNALYTVVYEGAYSSLYLKQHLHEVDKKNQALATTIFYGTLRNYRYCQAMWKQYANQNKVNKKIKVLLTMSVYQLLFLDKVPSYAVIDEAVRCARQIRKPAAGFVNALLRQVDRNRNLSFKNEEEEIALTYSLPEWIVKMWTAQYGAQKALEFAKASLYESSMSVRRNVMKELPRTDRLIEIEEPVYRYCGKALEYDPLYKEGIISPQDLGAYDIVRMIEPKAGETILDMCAAPGTKTMAMAETMNNTGHIDALDLHEHRAELIRKDAARLDLDIVHATTADATDLSDLGMYDKILCDVPCSGYGTLARKPDIKLHMQPTDMDTLIPVQHALLDEASKHVRKGGLIVYSTCTLNKKENEKQVERFLNEHEEFDLLEQKTIEPGHRSNGFFAARLRKRK